MMIKATPEQEHRWRELYSLCKETTYGERFALKASAAACKAYDRSGDPKSWIDGYDIGINMMEDFLGLNRTNMGRIPTMTGADEYEEIISMQDAMQ